MVFVVEFTENQERKIQILILRNIYFKENPVLLKDHFSKEDTVEVDAWIKEIKYIPLIID